MRLTLLLGALLIACGCSSADQSLIMEEAGHQTQKEDLWMKAVKLADANRNWVPGRLEMRNEIQDGSHQTEQVELHTYRKRIGEDGQVVEELVKATRDGKDVTAELQKQEAGEKTQAEGSVSVTLYATHPFLSDDQDKVTVEPTDQVRTIQDKTCVGYKYRFQVKPEVFTSGMAWLDQSNGVPLEIVFTQRPLPSHAKSMTTTIKFEHTPEGHWREVELKADGEAGILFFTKYLVNLTTMSEYFQRGSGVIH